MIITALLVNENAVRTFAAILLVVVVQPTALNYIRCDVDVHLARSVVVCPLLVLTEWSSFLLVEEDGVFGMSTRPGNKKRNHGAILVTSERSRKRAPPGRNPGHAAFEMMPFFWAPIWAFLLLG